MATQPDLRSRGDAARSEPTRHSDGWWETIKIVLQALAIAFMFKWFLYQPFNIPSGSMKPTLLIGDYLFVSKLSYGYGPYSVPVCVPFTNNCIKPFSGRIFAAQPKRGDVIVFKNPRDGVTDYIKRLIGLPGDTVQMKQGVLIINGQAVTKKPVGTFSTLDVTDGGETLQMFEETLPEGKTYRILNRDRSLESDVNNYGPMTVPAGRYFFMGDNRDNSLDSRAGGGPGMVPFENLIGRAEIVFFSAAIDEPGSFRWYKPWTWPSDVRYRRFLDKVR